MPWWRRGGGGGRKGRSPLPPPIGGFVLPWSPGRNGIWFSSMTTFEPPQGYAAVLAFPLPSRLLSFWCRQCLHRNHFITSLVDDCTTASGRKLKTIGELENCRYGVSCRCKSITGSGGETIPLITQVLPQHLRVPGIDRHLACFLPGKYFHGWWFKENLLCFLSKLHVCYDVTQPESIFPRKNCVVHIDLTTTNDLYINRNFSESVCVCVCATLITARTVKATTVTETRSNAFATQVGPEISVILVKLL